MTATSKQDTIKWASIGLILLSCLLLMRALPIAELQGALKEWIGGLGFWGPIVFVLIYIVATVCLIPGSALTLVGGAIFGLWIGFASVSVGSVIGAGCAFLIARYLARSKVEKLAESNKKFAAIDQAISEGGWKIVGMLRLSPAIPFNLQNYLYGLTDIKFWPYLMTSWIAMIPGTFMYVYLGHAAGAAAGGGEKSVSQWVLLGVGLLATIAVTVYITYLAKQKLAEQTDVKDDSPQTEKDAKTASIKSSNKRFYAYPVAAVVMLTTSIFAYLQSDAIAQFARSVVGGPPEVTMQESYEPKPDGPSFDHSKLAEVLNKYVFEGGWVDYAQLKKDSETLEAYIAGLEDAPFEELGRNEKLALLINAYNACTLKLITENYPIDSIKDIPVKKRWATERWNVGGQIWSLSQIEHEQIRPHFKEPRIHFALVCAAVGCPPLATEVYKAEELESQLQRQAEFVHSHHTWLQVNSDDKTVRLTRLYDWYRGDFEQAAGSAIGYAAKFSRQLNNLVQQSEKPRVVFLDYDWKLNSLEGRLAR